MTHDPTPPRDSDTTLDRAFALAVDLLEVRPGARIDDLVDELIRALTPITAEQEDAAGSAPPNREALAEVVRLAYAVVPGADAPGLPQIPGYTFIRELGRGGMGAVFLARQDRLAGRVVAVKVLPAGAAISYRARERFRREAEAVARLHHPGIIVVHDVIESPGLYAYAMEYIDGPSLALLLERLRPYTGDRASAELQSVLDGLPAAETKNVERFMIRVCAAAAEALAAVHEAGMLHRDVKPSNILLRRDGTALLSDFGLVRDMDATMTEAGHFAGTPTYAPPEQLRGETLDARADVYALGVTLFHSLTGSPPYTQATTLELIRRIESGTVPSLRRSRPAVSRDLELVVAKAMDPDPACRYQSARAFADDLQRLLDDRTVLARPATTSYLLRKFLRRNPVLVAGLLAVLVTLTLGLAGTMWQARTATIARDAARADREIAQSQAYVASITAADAALRASDPMTARAALMQAEPDRRGWEWWYLESKLDASIASMPTVWAVNAMALSPDGRWAAASATNSLVFDVNAVRLVMREPGKFDLAAFSPDSSMLATLIENSITLRELSGVARSPGISTNGDPAWRTMGTQSIDTDVSSIAFSPDGHKLMTAHLSGILREWNIPTLSLAGERRLAVAGPVRAWNHAHGLLAIGVGSDLVLINGNTGESLLTLSGNAGTIKAAAIAATGTRIATISEDSTVHVWDIQASATSAWTCSLAGRFLTPEADKVVLDISPDGRRVAVAGNRLIRLYDARTGTKQTELAGHSRAISTLAFRDDGATLVSAGSDISLKVWNVQGTRESERTLAPGAEHDPLTAAISADAVADLGMVVATRTGVTTLDASGLRLLGTVTNPSQHPVGVSGSATLPIFSVAWNDGSVSVHDWPTGHIRWSGHVFEKPRTPEDGIWQSALAPDGDRVLVVGESRAVMWDGATSSALWSVPLSDRYRGVAISPDGRFAVISEDGFNAVLRDSHTGKEVRHWAGPGSPSQTVTFSRDGSWLVMGSLDRTVRVWDVASGNEIAVLSGSPVQITRVRFSPHANPRSPVARLFSLDTRGMLRVWNVQGGTQLLSILASPGGWGESLAISPDESAILVCMNSSTDASANSPRYETTFRSRGPAGRLVSEMLADMLVPARVIDALKTRPGLDDQLRTDAIEDARRRSVDPSRLNSDAWSIACFPRQQPERYALAETLATAASELAPENGHIHGTLATALYRTGKFQQALDESHAAEAINGPFLADTAVRAMILARLGRLDEAAELVAHFYESGGEPGLLVNEARQVVNASATAPANTAPGSLPAPASK